MNEEFLNKCRITEGPLASKPADGFNGMFAMRMQGKPVLIIAADGMGWKHVSMTIQGEPTPPTWEMMCRLKALFFHPEDCVMQLHPPQSQYVNKHPGCLHLWMPTTPGVKIPQPPNFMVG